MLASNSGRRARWRCSQRLSNSRQLAAPERPAGSYPRDLQDLTGQCTVGGGEPAIR